ncbi:MAG: hypothetical protein RBT11_07920 [Desulfobacterales bacterium]|jgi:hypothetical protein|nr:hypothetical protein [Desulfobacterales bacterium]
MEIFPQLKALIRNQTSKMVLPGIDILRDTLLARYGNAVQAILVYGSCLRNQDANDGLVDLYLLVDSYRHAYRNPLHGMLNQLLPPNVFYMEANGENSVIRAKYAIVSLADFQQGTSTGWFHSYLWGRFAQPTGIVFCRDESVADRIYTAFSQAVITLVTRALPNMPAQFDARMLWCRGLSLSYRAELRAERPEKLVRLFERHSPYYEQLTRIVVKAFPYAVNMVARDAACHWQAQIPPRIRWINRLAWQLRFIHGKLLSLLRLLKALLTFKGGIEYVLWKIKRHSGISVEIPAHLRRTPLLGLCYMFWKLYQTGAFR